MNLVIQGLTFNTHSFSLPNIKQFAGSHRAQFFVGACVSDLPASLLSSPPTGCISGSLMSWQLGCVLVVWDVRIVEASPEILYVLPSFTQLNTPPPPISGSSKYYIVRHSFSFSILNPYLLLVEEEETTD